MRQRIYKIEHYYLTVSESKNYIIFHIIDDKNKRFVHYVDRIEMKDIGFNNATEMYDYFEENNVSGDIEIVYIDTHQKNNICYVILKIQFYSDQCCFKRTKEYKKIILRNE